MKVDEYAERAAEELISRTRPDAIGGLHELLRLRRRRITERVMVTVALIAVVSGGVVIAGHPPDPPPEPSRQPHGVRNGALIGRPLGGAGVVLARGDLPFVPDVTGSSSISFTQDGRTLVYSDVRGNAVALDEITGRTTVVYRCHYRLCDSRISPDGKRLVVDQPHGSVVVRLDLPSADPVELPGVFGTWSPDSTHLAFDTRGGLAVVDADDGRSEVIAPRLHFRHAAWSPDGSMIAVAASTDRRQNHASGSGVTRYSLVVVDIADGATRTLASLGSCVCLGVAVPSVAWSPDGRLIAFTRLRSGPPHEASTPLGAWTIRPDGNDLSPVDSVQLVTGALAWRPVP